MRRIITTATVALAALAPAAAQARTDAPDVPTEIVVPAGHKVSLIAHATGVQIYACNAGTWGFVAPRADLYDDSGKLVATHYAGPTWQARDGSTVVGKREAGVNVDPSAIDWLRLAAASHTGADGDRFASITYIQRIATTGGRAPAGACEAGTTTEVPYTADYVFWKAQA